MALRTSPLDSFRDRALLLRQTPIFQGVDDSSLAIIANHVRGKIFAPGDIVARAGQTIEAISVIARGKVSAGPERRAIEDVEPFPSTIGLAALLAGHVYGFDVVAEEETLVLQFPAQVMMDVLEEHFVVIRQLLRLSARAILKRLKVGAHGDVDFETLLRGDAKPGEEDARTFASGSRVEMLLRFREEPMFARADVDALFAILDHRRPFQMSAGEVLWRVGDRVEYSVMLASGTFRCTIPGESSITIGPPMSVGSLEAIADEPTMYNVVAESDVRGMRLDVGELTSVLESHFELSRAMLAGTVSVLL